MPDPVPTWQWWAIAACLAFSAYFSGNEAAFLSLSRHRVLALLRKKPLSPGALRLWADRPQAVLSSILIGNNLVNVAASALTTTIANNLFGDQSLALAIGITTLLVLVCGEIFPKVLALRFAAPIAANASWGIFLFYWITWPFTALFMGAANTLVRATGGDPSREYPPVTVEELELLVAGGVKAGSLQKLPADLISRALAFSHRRVREVMVPRTEVVALELGSNGEDAARLFNRTGHSRFPVYRGQFDDVVGIFHVKDLLGSPPGQWGSFQLASHLRPPPFVPETASVGSVLRQFQRRGVHLAVVVDEFGGTEGILTLEDILEELVGEIRDEHEPGVVSVKRLPSGAVEVTGGSPLEEVFALLSREQTENAALTVAGLLLEETGRVPHPGESFDLLGLRFTVTASDERRIRRVRVEPLPPKEEES